MCVRVISIQSECLCVCVGYFVAATPELNSSSFQPLANRCCCCFNTIYLTMLKAGFGVKQKGKEGLPTQASWFFYCMSLYLSTAVTAAKTCPTKPEMPSPVMDIFIVFMLLQHEECGCPCLVNPLSTYVICYKTPSLPSFSHIFLEASGSVPTLHD